MKKLHLLILGLTFFLSSCSLYQIDSEETTYDFYPSKTSPDEILYLENVNRPHEAIGQVRVNTERVQKDIDGVGFESILLRLKREAAVMGGDAITNIHTDTGTGKWAKNKPKMFNKANVRVNYIADVIVFDGSKNTTSKRPQ